MSSEEFPYPNVLPLPPSYPHSEDFRTRLLQLARLEKDSIHQEHEKRLKRRHSIASSSPWTRLSLGLPPASKLPNLAGGNCEELKFQARALNEAKELLHVLALHPTASSGHTTRRPSSLNQATRSHSSLSGKKTQSTEATSAPASSLSRSKSCISLSASTAFAHQQAIRTKKTKRPQSATCRSSRRIRRHERKEQQSSTQIGQVNLQLLQQND